MREERRDWLRLAAAAAFVLVLVSACASETDTSIPVPTPTPTFEELMAILEAQEFALQGLAVADIITPESQRDAGPDGRLIMLTDTSLGGCYLVVTYPPEMRLGKSERIRAGLVQSPSLARLESPPQHTMAQAKTELTSSATVSAELMTTAFAVASSSSDARRYFTTADPATWQWIVTPRESDTQTFTILLHEHEVVLDETHFTTYPRVDISLDVSVTAPSFWTKVRESISSDPSPVVAALLGSAGGTGLIVALANRGQSDRESRFTWAMLELRTSVDRLVSTLGASKESSETDREEG